MAGKYSVPMAKLGDAISQILQDYSEEVTEEMQDAVELVTKAGARAVQQTSRAAFNGKKYAGGWRGETKRGRLTAEGTIYNAVVPGLPHLLEWGHAKRGGGRVPGRSHIAPVENKITKQFEQKIRAVI